MAADPARRPHVVASQEAAGAGGASCAQPSATRPPTTYQPAKALPGEGAREIVETFTTMLLGRAPQIHVPVDANTADFLAKVRCTLRRAHTPVGALPSRALDSPTSPESSQD